MTIPGPWSPRPPRSSSGGPPETSPGVLSKKEVRLWQLHVQRAVKPPHCTSQLFRRKPLFCVETKEPFFSAHTKSSLEEALVNASRQLHSPPHLTRAPLFSSTRVHDTHLTILWLNAGLFRRNVPQKKTSRGKKNPSRPKIRFPTNFFYFNVKIKLTIVEEIDQNTIRKLESSRIY